MPKGVYQRKRTRKTIIRLLDKLVGDIVKARDKRCVTCSSTYNLQPGHLFTRAFYSTRWDLENVFAQCQTCNFKHEYDPFPLTKYYLDKFGNEAYERLHRKFKTVARYKTWQLIELYEKLKKETLAHTRKIRLPATL